MSNEAIQFKCIEQFREAAEKEEIDAHSFKEGFERAAKWTEKEIIERALDWMCFNVEDCLYINDNGVYELNGFLLEDRFIAAMNDK